MTIIHYLQACLILLVALTAGLSIGDEPKVRRLEMILGPAEPLPRQLYTFNTDLATAIMFRGVGYDSVQFEDAVRQLRPQGLRFPGGTLANNYLWRKDSFSEPTNDQTGWAGEHLRLFRQIGLPYDLPGFARVVKRFAVEPIWVLNVYEETPQSVVALIDHLQSLGLNVRCIEMANEPYWDGRSLAQVDRYIAACQPLADAIRSRRPDIKIGACFAPLNNPANYEVIWNAPLAKETWFDAIVFHDYYGGQGFVLEPGETVTADALVHPEAIIEEPVNAFAALMPGVPIWFTEWNIGMQGLEQWKNTGAELQFIAATFSSLIENRQAIEMACFHAFYDARFGAFYLDDQTNRVKTNASYELFQMIGASLHQADGLRPLQSPTDKLRGFVTQKGDEIRWFLLNRGQSAIELSLPGKTPSDNDENLVAVTIDCRVDRDLTGEEPLAVTRPISGSLVTLPAQSITAIGAAAAFRLPNGDDQSNNLFPRRPDLLFWYPPYATEQPRFDASGVYTMDLSRCRDKPMAVLKMNLASSGLQPGVQYAIQLEAKSDQNGGIAVRLPEAGTTDGIFWALGDDYSPKRFTFEFDASVNDGEVVFVFPEEIVSVGAVVTMRNFRIFQP